MNSIIVTVTNVNKTFMLDLELPLDVAADQLAADVVEALTGYDERLALRAETASLFCNRLGRRLTAQDTLESAGVWNGDYITMIEG